MKNTNFFERIMQIVDYYGINSINEFAKEYLGYSSSEKINRLKKEGASPSYDILLDISKKFENINVNWLLTGDGGMLYDCIVKNESNGVPYYDIDVTATITESFSDVKEIPEFYVDFKPFNDCTAYVPVFGDSMYPSYASGEIIAIKEVKNRDAIYWGEVYLVITNSEYDNIRTIKQVHFHEDETKVILRASNPNFKGDTVIPKEAIIKLYTIKGKVTRKQM